MSETREVPPVRPAATVIVVRSHRAGGPGIDVLLVRRHRDIAFMGGAYVFPGGRVDDADAVSGADPAGVEGLDAVGRFADLPPLVEAAFRVAAIRELLEEAGVLLARPEGAFARPEGTFAGPEDVFADRDTADRLRRAPLPAGVSMAAHAAAHGVRLALDAVMPFAHWVTPPIETKRYDTRFLMARMPAGQEASHDEGETTALEWVTPADAVARAEQGAILLPPPTWTTLKRLARFPSVDDAWRWAATTPIVRIQPGFSREGGVTTLTLPGDPTYPLPPGLEPIEDTRFVLENGAWRPVRR
jgi:8-oxo-dGTP pyrophosphatase MutT (NUDIX family)